MFRMQVDAKKENKMRWDAVVQAIRNNEERDLAEASEWERKRLAFMRGYTHTTAKVEAI